eukprot:scaffold462_cov195-Pinguiococcus_pyrenoidosus.AAC.92
MPKSSVSNTGADGSDTRRPLLCRDAKRPEACVGLGMGCMPKSFPRTASSPWYSLRDSVVAWAERGRPTCASHGVARTGAPLALYFSRKEFLCRDLRPLLGREALPPDAASLADLPLREGCAWPAALLCEEKGLPRTYRPSWTRAAWIIFGWVVCAGHSPL